MTNSELIEYLSQFPDDARVVTWGGIRADIDEKDIDDYIRYDESMNEITI